MADRKTNIAAKVRNAVESVITDAGYKLWDVTYYKEGPEMILEIAIDSENGISINDCSEVTRLVEPIIDELDPIEESYCLQVASAGTVRPLDKSEHLDFACANRLPVTLGLYVAVDGSKEFKGIIEAFDSESVTLLSEGVSRNFTMKQISKINAEFETEEIDDDSAE
ncbi:MAG: ribosome maturation factor RimP [Clostridia bacterium]|nr:ribosome maturation factor RimP [Clostridia bacterium]MBQ9848092.1 ribosome maturation factor RimP [Clostridia bacterium]